MTSLFSKGITPKLSPQLFTPTDLVATQHAIPRGLIIFGTEEVFCVYVQDHAGDYMLLSESQRNVLDKWSSTLRHNEQYAPERRLLF